MIVLGQTGSGKTTLLNFFLNYYLGIQIDTRGLNSGTQSVSQTQEVKIYYVKPIDNSPALRIIDTPGFGDTKGILQDKKIITQIENCFRNKRSIRETKSIHQCSHVAAYIDQIQEPWCLTKLKNLVSYLLFNAFICNKLIKNITIKINCNFQDEALSWGDKRQFLTRLRGNGIVTILDYQKAKKTILQEALIIQKVLPTDIKQLFAEIDDNIAKLQIIEESLLQQLQNKEIMQQIQYLKFYHFNIFPIGYISQILGEVCSGKTALLWKLILNNYEEYEFIYLDCGNSLNAIRIDQILQTNFPQPIVQLIQKSIRYKCLSQISELYQLDYNQINNRNVIIFDGLLTLFQSFDQEIYSLQHIINEFYKILYKLCIEKGCTIIISNRSIQENISQIQNTKFDQYINQFIFSLIHLYLIKQNRIFKIHKGLNQNEEYDTSIQYKITDKGFEL